jgi:2-methylcitrate dehydratase PrpD
MTGEDYIVQRLATQAKAFGPEQLTEQLAAKAKRCLTYFLSAAFEAADLPWSRQAAGIAHACESGTTAIALGRSVAPGDAAFANAVAGHGLVREDMHTASIAHIGIVVWPALLAFAARSAAPVSGKALLVAAVVGYEAGARLGAALMTAELAQLFRPTGLIGAFASAMAVGRLADLGEDELAVALSLAANCAGGLNEWPSWGGSEMYFQAGFAARNGLAAVDLARAGAFASPSIIEGAAGLFAAFARRDANQDIALKLDSDPAILSVFHKAVPACNFAQTPAQAALAAARNLGGDSSVVTAIEARITRAASLYPGCNAVGPFENVLQAKMSIQFGVASAVRRKAIDAQSYISLDDAETARLVAATRLVVDDELTAAFPTKQGARVTLRCADGTEVGAHLDDVETASPEMVEDRFAVWAAHVLGPKTAAELGHFLDELETVRDVAPLDRLLRRGPLSKGCSGKA